MRKDLEVHRLESAKKQAELHHRTLELEMQALRAQMNPHFIFNCLSSINRFIFKNDNKLASDYLTHFSRLIRMVLMNSSKKLITLEEPVVLTGDYNVMPTEMDVYKPERWTNDALFRVEVREAFAKLAAQGWTDAIRKLHPKETIYTFWDYFRDAYGRNAGLRIDHFLLNDASAKRLRTAEVDRHVRGWEKSSDHAPVWIQLR